MAPIMPPSALALSTLPGSGPPSLPESSGPRTTPHGLNLLALLQSTGNVLVPATKPYSCGVGSVHRPPRNLPRGAHLMLVGIWMR